ncbi:Fe2+-dependent dioxygenase [Noviherbaspirillum galbum]|uniref:Fe2+-dependent dioxygenase n=1 Tax=Noviherbaspirillum galbum TaxID=2709383 RepID=A0A6B3SPB2_9BURK|nr:Fe2+-dependent dioxygenase [Noviherbaspirillum galbum]NEX59559.1 Fe2+-dependent dioxygenase [Noviherbaspirillum galbum]
MLLHVPRVLEPAALRRCRDIVEGATWLDGGLTAGTQSAQVKNNRQLSEASEASQAARAIVVDALAKSALFFSAALPKKTFPPLFNRYDGSANAFGNHIDNAVRTSLTTGDWVRTDLSVTLFLSDPEEYDGGELVVQDTFGTHRVKLPAGDLVLYPSSSVHRVEPVTRGSRIASFFWVESMVRRDDQRRLLFDMDMAIQSMRDASQGSDSEHVVSLTGCYHNLMRMWAET